MRLYIIEAQFGGVYMNNESNMLLKEYKRELQIIKYSLNTIKNYYAIVKNYFDWIELKQEQEALSLENVKRYLLHLFERGLSSNTISLQVNALKSFFRLIVKTNILDELRHPKRNKSLPDILSRSEIIVLLNTIENEKHKIMIASLYGSGLRVGELVQIKVKDLDFIKNRITIRKGKGRKDRIVIISKQLLPALRKMTENKDKLEYLFKPQYGKKYSKRTAQHIFSVALKKSGIKKHATCHTLRHSFATHLLENGNNIVNIQKLLGHKNVNTTMIYTKLAKNNLDDIDSPL